jgi:U3 small nucleolar RNA-associated protein 6
MLDSTDRLQDEISSIARKRSDFEHKINARGCQPSDYARYAEFEINIDSLRRKRVKRLRVKAPAHTGQRRVFFILDRATRKFPGDIGLWTQQIEYARVQKAYKKLSQILTKVLRLHPSNADLWTYAGNIAMEDHGDMTEARSFMQRGLRFCKSSKSLWLEYMKLEFLCIARITARRQILGIDEGSEAQKPRPSSTEMGADPTNPPRLIAEAFHPNPAATDNVDDTTLQNVVIPSALSGAIPIAIAIAIFDAAMVQFQDDEGLAQGFFDTVQDMDSIHCTRNILKHIVDHMLRSRPSSWRTLLCNTKLSSAGIAVTSPEFPKCFGQSLKTLQRASPDLRNCRNLVDAMQSWLEGFLDNDSLDVALRQIVLSTLRQLQAAADPSHAGIDGER